MQLWGIRGEEAAPQSPFGHSGAFRRLDTFAPVFQEVAPVGAFDERAFGPDISVLVTREEQKLRKLLSPFRQIFGIELWELDLKVRRSDGLRSPTLDTCVTCTT